ncbi:hypothetical protein RFM26_02695 [Mesorhizobium sp. VK23B]|uniref:Uncharacterized protein n=1 Tax=Mesorhizobium dulcispinae TaxID=3072316 RepID=A0ABU4X853_9HYPH|nr:MULTISPECIES: hypothetical protein [unclassified Mesorhizobium]MDX8464594.1 hypothetical protein [Mesorhizobium sp. VK23B]MDX8470980.1 hypothetical protein [Mesorhizobium sp. VK23A]
MREVAIQISAAGLSWAYIPDPISLDADNPVEGHFKLWPELLSGGPMPIDMAERQLTYQMVYRLAENADFVLLAFEPDADLRRVGIAEVALEAIWCGVQMVEPHPDRAAGIMRDHVQRVVETSPRPPGMG